MSEVSDVLSFLSSPRNLVLGLVCIAVATGLTIFIWFVSRRRKNPLRDHEYKSEMPKVTPQSFHPFLGVLGFQGEDVHDRRHEEKQPKQVPYNYL
jgi:hypothetical protein